LDDDDEVDDDNDDNESSIFSQEAVHENEDEETQKEARARQTKSNTICSKCHRNKMQFNFCDTCCKDEEPGKTTYQDIVKLPPSSKHITQLQIKMKKGRHI
jgi:hypothetical protein